MGCNLRDLAVFEPLQLSDLSGQRVAVDVFLNAYQFITSLTGQDGKPLSYNGKPVAHLMGFLDRTTVMLSEGIDPVFVFDGRPHELQRETLKGRKERKLEAVARGEAAVERAPQRGQQREPAAPVAERCAGAEGGAAAVRAGSSGAAPAAPAAPDYSVSSAAARTSPSTRAGGQDDGS